MELVLVVTFAGLIGTALRYILPGRQSHGLAMMPSVAIIAGSLGWALSVWVGLDAGGPWGWVVALVLAFAATMTLGIVVPRRRAEADDALVRELTAHTS
jgi:hypothetical protein